MRKHWRVIVLMVALVGLVGSVPPLAAHSGSNSFDDHWLAAACPEASPDTQVRHRTARTEFGVAVEHGGRFTGPIVFHCDIEADDYHNWLQFYAEDQSPTASATVSVFRQNVVTGGPPELLTTLTSTDQAGLQRAELFIDPALEFTEFTYMYYLELVIYRANTRDVVRLYSVSLLDVL